MHILCEKFSNVNIFGSDIITVRRLYIILLKGRVPKFK